MNVPARLITLALVAVGLALAPAVLALPRSANAEQALACPSGAVTILRGGGHPHTVLLVFFAGRPVGGGLSDAAGGWEIPLLVTEAPGVYPVEVRTRDDNQPVKRFSCFVDQPVATPTIAVVPPSATATRPSQSVTATTTLVAATPGSATSIPLAPASRTAAPVADPTGSASPQVSAQASATSTQVTDAVSATPTPTATRTQGPTVTPTITPSPSPTEEIADITLLDITDLAGSNPDDPDDLGYVVVENSSSGTVNIGGWSIGVPQAGRPRYSFPSLLLHSGEAVTLEVSSGADDREGLTLYWNRSAAMWYTDDDVALYGPGGDEKTRATVP